MIESVLKKGRNESITVKTTAFPDVYQFERPINRDGECTELARMSSPREPGDAEVDYLKGLLMANPGMSLARAVEHLREEIVGKVLF